MRFQLVTFTYSFQNHGSDFRTVVFFINGHFLQQRVDLDKMTFMTNPLHENLVSDRCGQVVGTIQLTKRATATGLKTPVSCQLGFFYHSDCNTLTVQSLWGHDGFNCMAYCVTEVKQVSQAGLPFRLQKQRPPLTRMDSKTVLTKSSLIVARSMLSLVTTAMNVLAKFSRRVNSSLVPDCGCFHHLGHTVDELSRRLKWSKKETSTKTYFGWWNAPTKFFPKGVSTAVFSSNRRINHRKQCGWY